MRRLPLGDLPIPAFFFETNDFLFEGRADAMFCEIDLGAVHPKDSADLGNGAFFDDMKVIDGVMRGVYLPFHAREGLL